MLRLLAKPVALLLLTPGLTASVGPLGQNESAPTVRNVALIPNRSRARSSRCEGSYDDSRCLASAARHLGPWRTYGRRWHGFRSLGASCVSGGAGACRRRPPPDQSR